MFRRAVRKYRRDGGRATLDRGVELANHGVATLPGVRDLTFYLARRRLLRQLAGATDVETTIDVLTGFEGYGLHRRWAPVQLPDELASFVEFCAEAAPERVVEVGLGHCGTTCTLLRHVPSIETYVCVDLPMARYYRCEELLNDVSRGAEVSVVLGNSRAAETREAVAAALGGPADLLFVDADHRYDGVRGDYETYRGLVADGGHVAFHDIRAREDSVIEVDRLWQELCGEFETSTFLAEYDLESPTTVAGNEVVGHGIGVLHV